MTTADILAAFALPPQAAVGRRVPKALLLEHGAPTAADRRAVADGIDELTWAATLKPATVGVPAFRDAAREYLEVAVLSVTYRPKARAGRLRELVHRAIPYPVVLIGSDGVVSLAELRHAQNAAGKTVLDGDLLAADPAAVTAELAFDRQPATDLAVLYRGWCGVLAPLVRRAGRLAEAAALRKRAGREPQLARRVELNRRLRELTADEPPPGTSP